MFFFIYIFKKLFFVISSISLSLIYNIKILTTDTLPPDIWKRTILKKWPFWKIKSKNISFEKRNNRKQQFWKRKHQVMATPNKKHFKLDSSEKGQLWKRKIWKKSNAYQDTSEIMTPPKIKKQKNLKREHLNKASSEQTKWNMINSNRENIDNDNFEKDTSLKRQFWTGQNWKRANLKRARLKNDSSEQALFKK